MSFSWFVYSPLSETDAVAVEERLRVAIDALLEARPSLVRPGGDWGEITVGDAVPSADDVAEIAEAYDRDVSEDMLDRLDACRSALEIERNGADELDPLQVSILQWLLENLPPCLVDWGDFQIVSSEVVAKDLSDFPSAGSLSAPGEAAPVGRRPSRDEPSDEEPAADLERSEATVEALGILSADPFLQRRFDKLLEKYPEYVKNYVKLVVLRGALTDEKAADQLSVPVGKLAKQLDKLHGMATGLAEEADEE